MTAPSGAVLLVGASASGKSLLLNQALAIADHTAVLDDVRVARRFTTRAPREKESLTIENRFLDRQTFEEGVAAGLIDVSWRRGLAQGEENRYGFGLGAELLGEGLVILSGNNYLRWYEDPMLARLRTEGRLMIIRIHASEATRLGRLRDRRPALNDAELEARMADVPPDRLPPADHVIPNDPIFQASAAWLFVQLLAMFRFSLLSPPQITSPLNP